jgi:hypothetical protein
MVCAAHGKSLFMRSNKNEMGRACCTYGARDVIRVFDGESEEK